MSDQAAPASLIGETAKTLLELTKALKELGESNDKSPARSGPLQILGRLSLGLAVLLTTAASVSGFLDWQIVRTMPSDASHEVWAAFAQLLHVTWWMRFGVVVLVVVPLVGGFWLIWALFKKHPMLLSSPSELNPTVLDLLFRETVPGQKEIRSKAMAAKPVPGAEAAK